MERVNSGKSPNLKSNLGAEEAKDQLTALRLVVRMGMGRQTDLEEIASLTQVETPTLQHPPAEEYPPVTAA